MDWSTLSPEYHILLAGILPPILCAGSTRTMSIVSCVQDMRMHGNSLQLATVAGLGLVYMICKLSYHKDGCSQFPVHEKLCLIASYCNRWKLPFLAAEGHVQSTRRKFALSFTNPYTNTTTCVQDIMHPYGIFQ